VTIDQWLESAVTDAERRNLPALKLLLEAFARSLQALRDADFNDRADDSEGIQVQKVKGQSVK
jgi:hypothetical protein